MPAKPRIGFKIQNSSTFIIMQNIPNMRLSHPRKTLKIKNLITCVTFRDLYSSLFSNYIICYSFIKANSLFHLKYLQ